MSYELKKPYTTEEKAEFISNYCYNQGLRREETDLYLFALESNEIMGEKEIEIDVPDFDEDGNPIMIEIEVEVIIGYHTETRTVQQTHKETITIPYPVIDPDYEEKQAQKREDEFWNEFLKTSLGNYRLVPKGYANAQQSIDTVNAIVMYSQGLTQEIANKVIFYDTPDFTKPEECTEEWLVQHQHHPDPMTIQEWGMFYVAFSQAYAAKMYQIELRNNNEL